MSATAGLDVANPIDADAGVAIGVRAGQTLKATANNDALTALKIEPTFDDNGKTGVTHNGLVVASGNVGIGTTNPLYHLHLSYAGQDAFRITNSGNIAAYIQMGAGAGSNDPQLLMVDRAGNTNVSLSADDNGTGARYLFMNGNLGIGTTSPASLLHVNARTALQSTNTEIAQFSHQTSGTPADGFGSRILFTESISANGTPANSAAVRTARQGGRPSLVFQVGYNYNDEIDLFRIRRAQEGGTPAIFESTTGTARMENILTYQSAGITGGFNVGSDFAKLTANSTWIPALSGYHGVQFNNSQASTVPINFDWQNSKATFSDLSVGIGTTSPQAKLHVEAGAICVSAGAGSNDCSGAANTAGTIFAVNTTVQGADYAEYFASEKAMSSGDIVGINPNSGLVRPYQAGDKLVGVVSTQPGVIGNSKIKDKRSTLVALMGQVPFNRQATRIDGNTVKTIDGVQIGYVLASGDLYLQISSIDKKLSELKMQKDREVSLLMTQLKAEMDSEVSQLKANNEAMKTVLCQMRPEAAFCN